MYIVVDTETTGLDHNVDGIVEIAFVRKDETFEHSLCNPGIKISLEAMSVHHITDDMISNKIDTTEYLKSVFTNETSDDIIVAHNAEFDRNFICKSLPEKAEINNWICTYRCALHLFPESPKHSNQFLRYWLQLNPKLPNDLYPHRALYDAIVTESILNVMLHNNSIQELIKLSQSPVILNRVNFGKHRNCLWKDMPKDYLKWIVKQDDMNSDVIFTAKHYLN